MKFSLIIIIFSAVSILTSCAGTRHREMPLSSGENTRGALIGSQSTIPTPDRTNPEELIQGELRKLTITIGGGFQMTVYDYENGSLTHTQTSYASGGSEHTQNITIPPSLLESLLSKYSLATIHNDPLAGPDMTNYNLSLTTNSRIYQIYCIDPHHDCYRIIADLMRTFDERLQ